MIIVRLTGGLGNQLFQYAAARRLAQVNDAGLKLDLSPFGRNPARAYALEPFNLQATIAAPQEVAWFNGREKVRQVKRRLHNFLPRQRWTWAAQSSGYFDPTILALKGNVYLDGAWQSEKYFQDITPVVREELTFQEEPQAANRRLSEQIQQTEAVSLHVRRGDYAADANTRRVHGLCSLEYYHAAVLYLLERIPAAHFFVFSDDPGWARENLRLDTALTIVTDNSAGKAYEDLRLMSQCRHHIIANSSFSWWGAWLGANPGKIVIAPRQWFAEFEYDIQDIVPAEWMLL